ncbi:MAG: thioredoxin-dependent thiol peroxidase [Hyphomicrobiales bacterium]
MSQLLKVGDKAPEFVGLDFKGSKISLKDYLGKKVILYFYPKDNTPGCTAEACNLRDNNDDLIERGFKIIGVSPDNPKSHERFIDKHNLRFALISDPDRKIIELYNAWGLKKFMGKEYYGVIRKTFLINEQGVISHIIDKVKTKDHASQILELYK